MEWERLLCYTCSGTSVRRWDRRLRLVGLRGRMGVALVSLGLVGSVGSPPDRPDIIARR